MAHNILTNSCVNTKWLSDYEDSKGTDLVVIELNIYSIRQGDQK